MRWGRVEVSGGFLLLIATLYYLDTQNLLPWALLACALHELGHVSAIWLLGGQVTLLRLTCVGAELRLGQRRPLPRLGELLAALAGPGANLLVALLAGPLAGERGYLFAGLNLFLCAFNLLPIASLDGGRSLWCLLALLVSEPWADRVLRVTSLAVSGGLLMGGLLLAGGGRGNPTLLITAGWLLGGALREKERKK